MGDRGGFHSHPGRLIPGSGFPGASAHFCTVAIPSLRWQKVSGSARGRKSSPGAGLQVGEEG
jgi:hypothetical protein